MKRRSAAWLVLAAGLGPLLACRSEPAPASPPSSASASAIAAQRPQSRATTATRSPTAVRSRPPTRTSEPDDFDPITEIFEEPPPETAITPQVGDEPAAAYELEALREPLAFPRGLFFPLVLLGAWAASRAFSRATRFVLRLGLKQRRLISAAGALLSVTAWAWAFAAIVGRLLRAAPTLTLGVLTLASVAAVLVLRRQLESLAAGIMLTVRSRLREGDRIELGEHHGVVRNVGFTRVELHQGDGSRLYLPNRLVSTGALTIGPARYSVPLQVSLGRDRAWSAEEIHRARQLAGLSPYRDPSGRVVVEVQEEGEHRLLVQLQVWSPRLVAAAELHLRRQLDRHVAHRPGYGSDGERRLGERRATERRGL